jgi:hypothetical protein
MKNVQSPLQCPTRPPGDNTNACASTAFVQNAVAGGGGGGAFVSKTGDTMTGALVISSTTSSALKLTNPDTSVQGNGSQIQFGAITDNPYVTIRSWAATGPSPFVGHLVFAQKADPAGPLIDRLWLTNIGGLFSGDLVTRNFGGFYSYGAFNSRGYQAFIGQSQTSDLSFPAEAAVQITAGGYFIGVNNTTVVGGATNPAAYGAYVEGRIGNEYACTALEASIENTSSLDPRIIDPNNIFGTGGGPWAIGLLISFGGSQSGVPGKAASAAMVIAKTSPVGTFGKNVFRGIVFQAGSILGVGDGHLEAISLPANYELAWYAASGGVVGRMYHNGTRFNLDNGALNISSNAASTSTVTGALTVVGGVGIGGALMLSGDPTAALQAATKQYVDNSLTGLSFRASVALATTANVTLSGEQTIDGVLTNASRILVKNQTTSAQNGIYITSTLGWTRATDIDTWAEVIAAYTFVTGGNSNAGSSWVTSVAPGGTIGVTPMPWVLFSSVSTAVSRAGDTMTGDLSFSNGTADSPGVNFLSSGFATGSVDNLNGKIRFSGTPVNILDNTPASSTVTGALTVAGGLGVAGSIWTGAPFILSNGTSTSPRIDLAAAGFSDWNMDNFSGSLRVYYGGTAWFTLFGPDGRASFPSTVASSSPTTGALVVGGGLGVGAEAHIAGNIFGAANLNWANSTGNPGAFNSAVGGALGSGGDGGFITVSRAGASGPAMFVNLNADAGAVLFQRSGTGVGTISVTTTGTTYGTISDVRLKQDFRSFDAGPIIDAIQVHDFAWRETGERSFGVAAQEAVEVFPQAVVHDEKQDWWGTDYSKFVPLLLQEIKALRERVATLEGRHA